MTIEARIDAYGKEADGSALADYLELLALSDQSMSRADLADFISDNDWKIRSRELFQAIRPSLGDGEEPDEDVIDRDLQEHPEVEAANRVFEILTERSSILGDRYPFVVGDARLWVRDPLDSFHDGYLCLLATTVAHAYALDTTGDPRNLFEEIVAVVFAQRALTINMGEVGRQQGNFADALRFAASQIELRGEPDAAPRRTHANEAGVDTVSHFDWGDARDGHWVFIGQATCGKSETWERKAAEPKPDLWGPWLGSLVPPTPYLAVPHHIETHHLQSLTSGSRRLILDRLRLSRYVDTLQPGQRVLVDEVLAQEVVRP